MKSDMESRLRVMMILFIGSFSILAARLFYLQVIQGEKLRTIAESNRTQTIFERAPRGLILDKNGIVLADNRPTFVVTFTPLNLGRDVLTGVVERLSKILGLTEEELNRLFKPAIRHSSMVRLMDRVSRHSAFALAEQKPNLPGVSVVTEMQRRYPQNDLAAHILGFLGQVSPSEKVGEAGGYRPDVLVGKMGLEKKYDKALHGEDGGMRFEVNAQGRSLKILDRQETSVGYEIQTTLDFKIQKAAEEALKETGKAGAVVALDPRNGDVLAMVSAPQFDPNAFVSIRGEESGEDRSVSSLLIDPREPLFNRAIQGRYPPGSIFKVIALALAIESKKINPQETVNCPGFYRLAGRVPKTFLCWKKDGHQRMDLMEGMINSCNVYFYTLGLKLGPTAVEGLAGQFGVGTKTGIEIPGEDAGLMPRKNMFKQGKRGWYDGDTLNRVIGQGNILLTPLQAAMMASAVASHGKVYRPHLVKEVRTPAGEIFNRSKIELTRSISLSNETWDFVDQAMTQTVERGTGQSCKISGVKVGGKTGTAQNPQGKDHAWFIAFAPVDDPKIALSVLVEHGIQGSVAAAPIARKVILAALVNP